MLCADLRVSQVGCTPHTYQKSALKTHTRQNGNSPGNSPGAAAPAISLLHLLCNQTLLWTRAANRTCRLSVFKEVYLMISSFLKAVFEAVDR